MDNNDEATLMSEAIDHSLCDLKCFDALATVGNSATTCAIISTSTNVDRSEYCEWFGLF